MTIGWIQASERMTGRAGLYPDTLNRALRDVLTNSGYDPDAVVFPGLLGPVFNVMAFGAKGDGVTDDAIAVRAALVAANAAGGGMVFFPPRTTKYIIGSTLALYPNVRISAEGATIRFTGGASALFQFVGTAEAQPLNAVLMGPVCESATPNVGYGVRLRNFSNFYYDRCVFSGFSRGVKADWGIGLYHRNTTITGCTRGLETGGDDNLPAGIAAGVRGIAYHFMDSVVVDGGGFSQNVVDINDMGSLRALGGFIVTGATTFFEAYNVPITGKTTFCHHAARKGVNYQGGNWWENSTAGRACIVLSGTTYDGAATNPCRGVEIHAGNHMLVNGGVNCVGVRQVSCSGLVIGANAFEAATGGAAGNYAIELLDTVYPATVLPNGYLTGPDFFSTAFPAVAGWPTATPVYQASAIHLILDPALPATLPTGLMVKSFGAAIKSVASDYSLDPAVDHTVQVSAAGAARNLTLPAASTVIGKILVIQKSDSSVNTVTIGVASSGLINGAFTKVLATQYASVTVQASATEWVIVAAT